MEDNNREEILKRVIFELGVNLGEEVLNIAIEQSVNRMGIESAGGMPNLQIDIDNIIELTVGRFEGAKKEQLL